MQTASTVPDSLLEKLATGATTFKGDFLEWLKLSGDVIVIPCKRGKGDSVDIILAGEEIEKLIRQFGQEKRVVFEGNPAQIHQAHVMRR